MRAVVQRVLSASVVVNGQEISRIGKGLMCLIGICTQDTPEDLEYVSKKILNLRLFPDGEDETLSKQWAKSVMDVQGEILCVSQFTLHASTRKGSKPDFHKAMSTAPSKEFYTSFLKRMGELHSPDKIQDGEFGAMMQVSLTNEGPVTIIIDSQDSHSGNASGATSGKSTPELSAEKQAFLQNKQRKREENERRQRENAEKRQAAQAEFEQQKQQ
ncbi:hypothetical protein P389DRAFT_164897 [Cystobasidium minutum MCA 4210]|uniref:uncharacterized protein n=1 Tax=Cystobasidium minutum MCA 4210 TaxID=1397322 RepID=UPI0034CE315F|eukprot:jgi/Rhomi1/164897/fgenesh1_kg.1_\